MAAEGKASGRSGWDIRTIGPEDVMAVTQILQQSPEAASWSEQSIRESIALAGGVGLVCQSRGSVAGCVLGRQIADQAEILNLGVKPAARRQGIGGALLEAAVNEFAERGALRVYLEVRESNQAAIALYRAQGFIARGIRRGYYRNPDEPAVLMDRMLSA
jgi:ribosomal-protein-alanine N-acetyltransferase